MSDELKRLWEQQEQMRRLTDPLGDMRCYIDPLGDTYRKLGLGAGTLEFIRQEEERRRLLSGIADMGGSATAAADFERQRKMLEGPIEEARRLGLFDPNSDIRQSITATMQAQQEYERMFRHPEVNEISRLAREAFGAAELARSVFDTHDALQVAMAGAHSPWLRIEDAFASARAFSEIAAIGRGIHDHRAFELEFTDALRPSLGDWRDWMEPVVETLIDPILRSGFYQERGFDPALTDFTAPAFDENLRIAGLSDDEPADDEDDGFARARQSFDQLQRFERALRRFIDRVMTAAFGSNWTRHQLPANMLDGWIDKREKAVKAGQPKQALIEYADFSDYRAIIERKDNWSTVFKPVFGRPEDIRESFQRLFPVRIATMHARIVTQDDQLLLVVETKRVLKAINGGG